MLIVQEQAIPEEFCRRLIAEFENNPRYAHFDGDDKTFQDRVLFLSRLNRAIREEVINLSWEIAVFVAKKFANFSAPLYPETVSIVKWRPGESMEEHRDGEKTSEWRSHAVVVYLNKQSRGWGDIVFREMGVTVTPLPGTLVAYGKDVLHSVSEVYEDRYTLTIWLTYDKTQAVVVAETQMEE